MKGFFVHTEASDTALVSDAWKSIGYEHGHIEFPLRVANDSSLLISAARRYGPDVIFYVGASAGEGLPSLIALQELRLIAPTVNLCFDAADPPWHGLLNTYRREACFDLQVSIDGVREAPVDLVITAPINPNRFNGSSQRSIRCGFSGSIWTLKYYNILKRDPKLRANDKRSVMLLPLSDIVTMRPRVPTGPYEDYVDFLQQCQMTINTSMTGSGMVHHVKARVTEAALAGAVLLEMADAPTHEWFPDDSFFTYQNMEEAAILINGLDDVEISRTVHVASEYVKEHYTPRKLFQQILDRL